MGKTYIDALLSASMKAKRARRRLGCCLPSIIVDGTQGKESVH